MSSNKEPLISAQQLSEGQKAWDNFKAENSKWWKCFNGFVAAFCILNISLISLVLMNEETPEECAQQKNILVPTLVVHCINLFCCVINLIGKDELDKIYHPIAVAAVVLFEFSIFAILHFIHFSVLNQKYNPENPDNLDDEVNVNCVADASSSFF